MKKKFILLTYFVLFVSFSNATIHYVKQNASGIGSSWQNASGDLQLQIDNAAVEDTIWIAQGTYFPMRATDNPSVINTGNKKNSFVIKHGIKFFGGFDSTGNPGFNDRNYVLYPTILSGDIGIPNDTSDNCYHVVACAQDSSNIIMDGFTIKLGNANGTGATGIGNTGLYNYTGGGIYLYSCIPSFINIIVDSNYAFNGGGMYNFEATSNFYNVTFSNNASRNLGGGIINFQKSYPIYDHVTFVNNYAGTYGGAIDNTYQSYIRANNCEFSNNRSGTYGGAVSTHTVTFGPNSYSNVLFKDNYSGAYGGAIYVENAPGTIAYNSIFLRNNAVNNGGGAIWSTSLGQPVYAVNCTFYQNTGALCGGIMVADAYSTRIKNCLFWDNKATTAGYESKGDFYQYNMGVNQLVYSCLLSPTSTSLIGTYGNITGDPLFKDTASEDLSLTCGSPAIDGGDNSFYFPGQSPDVSNVHFDFSGHPRFSRSAVDIGAYEYIFEGDTISTTACKGESYVHNGVSYVAPFVGYVDTFLNLEGCDSFIVLQLNANIVDTVVNISNNTLTANTANATYQWIDCQTGDEIPGAVAQSFTPTHSGSYKVRLTANGCNDSSNCHNITIETGIDENHYSHNWNVFPNPVADVIYIEHKDITDVNEVYISDLVGKIVYDHKIVRSGSAALIHIDVHLLQKGIYFITLSTREGQQQTFKLVKN